MEKVVTSGQSGSSIYGLAQVVIHEAEPVVAGIPFLQEALHKLNSSATEYQLTVGSKSSDPYTEKAKNLDISRTKSYTSARDYVKAMIESPDLNQAAQAASLWTVFERYGLKLYIKNYGDKTTGLRLLISDLMSNNHQAEVNGIGARSWVDRLNNSATAFENCQTERSRKPSKTDSKKANQALGEMTQLLRQLIESLSLIEASCKDEKLMNHLNAIDSAVVRFNTNARSNRTRAQKVASNSDVA